MPDSDTPTSLSAGHWTALSLLLTLAGAGAAIGATYWFDPYCVFGDARGQQRRVRSADDRWEKYLFSMNYIPANFNGLLLGSSKTQNWDTGRMRAAKVYNCSFGGGNITEAKAIATNVFKRRRMNLVIFTVWPYMTHTSGFRSGALDPSLYWGALGSLRLFRAMADHFAEGLSLRHFDTNSSGAERYNLEPQATQWAQGKPLPYVDPRKYFAIDATAYREYGELISAARQQGALIVRMRPPVFYRDLEDFGPLWKTYNERIDRLFSPSDPLIDFQTPEFRDFSRDRRNFLDGAHLTPAAGDAAIDEMDRRLRASGFHQFEQVP